MTQATRFSDAFPKGLEIGGVPLVVAPGGKVFYVHDNDTSRPHASDNNAGTTADKPLATIDAAINKCTAGRGDVVLVLPGHAETITGAAGIAMDVAGVKVIGLGSGEDRPKITMSTAAAASIDITANGCALKNVILITSIDNQTACINAQAAGLDIDIEHRDNASTTEADIVILGNASFDNSAIKMKHLGFINGDAAAAGIKLVGSNHVDIDVDYYGIASTAVVNFATTACTNVKVRGRMHNASASVTKNVVDSQGSSTWDMIVLDRTIGVEVEGSDSITARRKDRLAGSKFLVQKSLTSSAITTGGVDVTGTASGGDIYIENILLEGDATGLATGTNFTIEKDAGTGILTFFTEAVTDLDEANVSEDFSTEDIAAPAVVLDSGQKLVAKCTGSSCTGCGVIDLTIVCRRLSDGANVAAA